MKFGSSQAWAPTPREPRIDGEIGQNAHVRSGSSNSSPISGEAPPTSTPALGTQDIGPRALISVREALSPPPRGGLFMTTSTTEPQGGLSSFQGALRTWSAP